MAAQQGSSPPRTVQGVFAQNRNEQVENKNWEGLALRQSKSQKALSSEEMKAEVSKMQESETTALTSDLAEWLSRVLKKDITAENLFDQLENGVLLCELSQIVTPGKGVSAPRPDAKRGSFYVRDNVAQFLKWVAGLHTSVTFEAGDLVDRKHPRNVVNTLMEVSRIAYNTTGLEPPQLVKYEIEIDKSNEEDAKLVDAVPEPPPPVVGEQKRASKDYVAVNGDDIDSAVSAVLNGHPQFMDIPIWRVKKGVYALGVMRRAVHMRLVNALVMVRVGGGWESLERYLSTYKYQLETKVIECHGVVPAFHGNRIKPDNSEVRLSPRESSSAPVSARASHNVLVREVGHGVQSETTRTVSEKESNAEKPEHKSSEEKGHKKDKRGSSPGSSPEKKESPKKKEHSQGSTGSSPEKVKKDKEKKKDKEGSPDKPKKEKSKQKEAGSPDKPKKDKSKEKEKEKDKEKKKSPYSEKLAKRKE